MRALEAYRRGIQRLVLSRIGQDSSVYRGLEAQASAIGSEGDLLRLPPDPSAVQPLRDADGNQLFMFGLSPFGGPDPFGG